MIPIKKNNTHVLLLYKSVRSIFPMLSKQVSKQVTEATI